MVTAIIGTDHYKTELISSGHTLLADEPEDIGGQNLGPSPVDLLLLSLASCTAITLRMYADRKNIQIEQIKVEVNSEHIGEATVFLCDVHLDGSLTEEQRQRMLQIAESCPVHKTLTNPIEVRTQLI